MPNVFITKPNQKKKIREFNVSNHHNCMNQNKVGLLKNSVI